MTAERFDAVVVGGGPSGATTALALAKAGWHVAVVEKLAFPRRKVCGEFLSATNLDLIDRLGIGSAWRRHAGPEVRRVGFFSDTVRLSAPMPARGGAYGRALGRDVLDELLLDAARAAGATVFQPWRAAALDRRDGATAIRIEGDAGRRELLAPVVVAAHGFWEPGGLPSQPDRVHRPSDLLGFKAHFRHAALPPDLMPLIAFPGGYGGMVWSDDGRLSLSCCIRRDALAALRERGHGSAGQAVQAHLVASCLGVREALGGAVLDGQWLAAGPIRPGIRPRYADDVFRVGNAAGEPHPIIAEGISMAIQSGWLLADGLAGIDPADREARAAAGRRYAAAWHGMFGQRVRAAALFAALALSPSGRGAMRLLVGVVPRLLTVGALLSGKTRLVAGLDRPPLSP